MPIQSRWKITIPSVSLPNYLFTSPTASLPTTPAIISTAAPETHFLTMSSYRLWSQRLALGLQKAGLQPGDRVLLYSGNTLFFPTVLMGVIMAGGIFTGANPTYVARELAHQLRDSGARFLLCAESSLPTGLEAAASAGLPRDAVFAFDSGAATFEGRGADVGAVRHWSALLAGAAEAAAFAWAELSTAEELGRSVALNYSSGTTGVPKGVTITHANYVANCAQTAWLARLDPLYEQHRARSRYLCFLPMYHAMAQTLFCVSAPGHGVPVYLMSRFDFLGMLEAVQRFRITDLILVPPVVVTMAKHPATRTFDLSSVERVGSGAAPLGREVCAELETLWPEGKINVKQGWGMTEATCTITTWEPNSISHSFSVGELAPNCEAKIVDDEAGLHEVKQGERGELWVRAPNVMKGYWGRPEATRETLTEDGWLRTGDIAYMDKENKLFIVDRKKELIKVKGIQVAPAELEALLLDHPAVADAAVVGVMIKGEEAPRAYIVLNQEQKVTAEDINAFMATRISKSKRLTGGVCFTDAIPKNPSGKILRKILRDKAKAEVGDSDARESRL